MPRYVCLTCGVAFTKNGARLRKYCSPRCYHEATAIPLRDRLWAKVVKTDTCWLFTGKHNEHGYGRLPISQGGVGKWIYAHRLAWMELGGAIPRGKHLCHRCDTPNCVRPDHLYVGTPSDNMRDKMARGRLPVGTGHWYHRNPIKGFRHPQTGRFQKVSERSTSTR
jgi:hypothetical protein